MYSFKVLEQSKISLLVMRTVTLLLESGLLHGFFGIFSMRDEKYSHMKGSM